MVCRVVSSSCLSLILASVCFRLALGEVKQGTISIEQGRDLVYALLEVSGCARRTCEVERFADNDFPQFFFFEALRSKPSRSKPSRSPYIGAWAVDRRTADLWDANVCVEYRPISVISLQERLRERIGLTEETYRELRQRPPMCDQGEKVEMLTVVPSWAGVKTYTSPDGILQAVVVTETTGEYFVDIRVASTKRILLSRDERSKDGEHGQGMVKAAWTPDSRYFLASTDATGGHQPWARPLWIYSRSKNHVYKVREAVSGVFTLKPPDIVRIPVIACDDGPDRILIFSIRRFVATGRLPIKPCPG